MFWRRLEDILKTSWRCLEDVLRTILQNFLKTSSQDFLKMSWRRFYKTFWQDVLKTFWRRMTKTNILVLIMTPSEYVWLRPIYSSWSKGLEDVFWRWRRKTSSRRLHQGEWLLGSLAPSAFWCFFVPIQKTTRIFNLCPVLCPSGNWKIRP